MAIKTKQQIVIEDIETYLSVQAGAYDEAGEAEELLKEALEVLNALSTYEKDYEFEADLEFKGVTLKEEIPVTPWTILVSSFLDKLEIKHEVDGVECVKVNRDSIINSMLESEQDSYDMLRVLINQNFKGTFNYTAKTDDWLLLEKIA